jgi:outer membrane protein OmpA-like peptidoglycan-associated protein
MRHRKPKLIILFFLSICLISAVESTAQSEGENEAKQFTSAELQAAVMSFADSWASNITDAAGNFARQTTMPEARLHAERLKYNPIVAAFSIAAGPLPGPALLDMLVLVTLMRIVWEEHWYPKVYGEPAIGMVEELKKLESEIWSIGASVLTPQQRQELRGLISQWRKEHPDTVIVYLIRFSNFGELGRKPSLEKARKSGGLLAPVKEAAQAANEIRAMADRTIYLLVRMQELVHRRAKLTVQDLLTTPEIDKLLSDITGFREVSERYAGLIENLPAQISDQTNATIDQVMTRIDLQSQEIVNHIIQQVEKERRAAVEHVLQGITQERKATFEQIIEGLEEQRTATIKQVLQGVAEERKAIKHHLTQLVDRSEQKAEEWITHIFVLVVAIVFVIFLLRLAHRYAVDHPAGTGHRRLAASVGLSVIAVLVVVVALIYVNRNLHKSSVTATSGQIDQTGDNLAHQSIKQFNRTTDPKGTADSAIVQKVVPAAKPSLETPSQQSPTHLSKKVETSHQNSSLAPGPASGTRETAIVEPEADNALDTGKPTSQPETVSNKDIFVAPKKETLTQTSTPAQKLQADVHPSTSEDRTQSTSGYKQIITKNFLFDAGGWQLKPETREALDELVVHIQKNVSLRLLIQGHSDSRGSDDLNQKLSEKRAEAVAAYLARNGVPSHRLTTVGYGSSQPVATNENPEGRAQNRRVVIKTILQASP